MKNVDNALLPPQRLAIAYAPTGVRPAFSLLLELDLRLARLTANASEPIIGQLKLAWWRDAIAMEPDKRPKGEPLLGRLTSLDRPGVDMAMSSLIDAWEILLAGDGSAQALVRYSKARGAAIFGTYAQWAHSEADVGQLGQAWALADLTGNMEMFENAINVSIRKLRPLTILALSVREVSGPRLLWHALTGR